MEWIYDKPKAGRPSKFTHELAAEICERLSDGEPLAQICRDEHMPCVRTVDFWREKDAEFFSAIARARARGFDAIAADTLRIADTPEEGVETIETEEGTTVKRGDMLGHRKLQIDTRLKLLAKWDPKRYGDKITQEHTGPDGGPVQITQVRRVIVDPKKPNDVS